MSERAAKTREYDLIQKKEWASKSPGVRFVTDRSGPEREWARKGQSGPERLVTDKSGTTKTREYDSLGPEEPPRSGSTM